VQGTCGWSDQSLVDCGRFYPRKGNISTVEKLSHFSRAGIFGCVEVDSTTYNIPIPDIVSKWVQSTPIGFKFHFKAFGFLVNCGGKISSLPLDIRKQFNLDEMSQNSFVSMKKVGIGCHDAIWERFHQALQPAVVAKKIGVVIFQFQLNFIPNESSRTYVEHCAEMLDTAFSMAVEFRNRKWLEGEQLSLTVDWLSKLRSPKGVALVACDDLEHEVYQKDSDQFGLPDGQSLVHLPVVLNPRSCNDLVYVRVHRRHGSQRILKEWEIELWRERIINLIAQSSSLSTSTSSCSSNSFRGPIYFLWGTDFEDQPMINALRLAEALPHHLLPLPEGSTRSKYSQTRDQKLTTNNSIVHAFSGITRPKCNEATNNEYKALPLLPSSAKRGDVITY